MKVQIRAMTTTLLCGVGLVGLSTAAFAQAAPADESGLDEIVVTANKRSENLQQAPLAISAVSAEQLELRGLSEIKDLSAIAPNVSILGGSSNATAAVVSIRGIPSAADETQGFDSPIGLYLDGVFLARSSAASFEVADIERVEVLRGPQGTLFGRNTTGGAINFITKKPSHDASLKATLGVGNYGLWSGKAVLNSGDMDGARLSFGVLHRRRNGVVDNLLEPRDSNDLGSYSTTGLRFAAEIDVTDNITIYNVLDYTKVSGRPHVQQLAEVGNGVFRPNVVYQGNTFAAVQPANVAAYLAASTIVEAGCPKTVSRARQDTLCSDADNRSTDTVWGNMFRIEADLDGVTIRSTSAYRAWENNVFGQDLDGLGSLRGPVLSSASTLNGMPLSTLELIFGAGSPTAAFLASQSVPTVVQPLFSASNDRRQRQFSQEIELVSNGDGPFQWVLGAFYFKESGNELNIQSIGAVQDTNAIVYNTTNFGGLAPLLQAGNPQRYRIVPVSSTLAYSSGGKSTAVYGQASYRPGGKNGAMGVTLGLRYTWDEKNVNRTQNGAAPFLAAEQALNIQSKKFSAPSGHLTVDYRASDDINFYARAARGYRSGGFNLRQATSVANNIGLVPFNEEQIWSYEVGVKTEFMNRLRLNVSAFHNVYSDQLTTIPIPIVGGGSFGTQTVNAGKTTYTGIEIEGQFKISDTFSIDGNFGYLDVNIKDFPGADITGVIRNVAGLQNGPSYAPKYTGSIAGNVMVPLSGDARLTARLGYNYTAGYQMFPNSLTAPFSQTTQGDARGLVDGQIRIDGIRLGGTSFGVTLWGKNITDKAYVTRAVDFGQLGFATVIYGDPATFGMSLDVEF
jgi:iron complex outermembrane receptor protein